MENKDTLTLQPRRYGTRSSNILGELSTNICNNSSTLTSSVTKDELTKKRRRSIRTNDTENVPNSSILSSVVTCDTVPLGSTEKISSRKTIVSSNENLSDNSCQMTRKTRSRTTKPNPSESLHGLVEAFVASSLISPPTMMNLNGTSTMTTVTKRSKQTKKSCTTSLRTVNRASTDNELLDASAITDPAMRTGGSTNISNTSMNTSTTTATLSTGHRMTDRDEDDVDDDEDHCHDNNNISTFSTGSGNRSMLLSSSSSASADNLATTTTNSQTQPPPPPGRRNSSASDGVATATAKAIARAGENRSVAVEASKPSKSNHRTKEHTTKVTGTTANALPVLQTIKPNVSQPVESHSKKEEKRETSVHPTATTSTLTDMNNTKAPVTKGLSITQPTTTASTTTTSLTSTPSLNVTDTGSEEYWNNYDSSIIARYKEKESDEELTPRHGYMSYQNNINDRMRAILIDWLIDVHYKYRLHAETLFLAINIIDRFLSRRMVPRARLQLVGVTAMWIACKRQEIWVPELRDFVYITDNAYTTEDILFCETEILRVLKFRLEVPTVYVFATHLLHHLQIEETSNVWHLTMYYLERSLQEYHFLRYFPSRIAAAAVTVTLFNLKGDDPTEEKYIKTIQEYTKYSFTELTDIIMDFQFVMGIIRKEASSHSVPLVAVDRKYTLSKYGNVAELTLTGPVTLTL